MNRYTRNTDSSRCRSGSEREAAWSASHEVFDNAEFSFAERKRHLFILERS
jgi:hypothetical protein